MLTASEMASATTPTTNTDVNALPTSRNGLRLSSAGRSTSAATKSSGVGAGSLTGRIWVAAAASPA
jgi:hypothetical protein